MKVSLFIVFSVELSEILWSIWDNTVVNQMSFKMKFAINWVYLYERIYYHFCFTGNIVFCYILTRKEMLSSFNLLLVALSIFDSCYVVGAFMESLRYVRGARTRLSFHRRKKESENVWKYRNTTFVYTLFFYKYFHQLACLRLIFAVVKRSQNFTCFKPPYSTRNVFSF